MASIDDSRVGDPEVMKVAAVTAVVRGRLTGRVRGIRSTGEHFRFYGPAGLAKPAPHRQIGLGWVFRAGKVAAVADEPADPKAECNAGFTRQFPKDLSVRAPPFLIFFSVLTFPLITLHYL